MAVTYDSLQIGRGSGLARAWRSIGAGRLLTFLFLVPIGFLVLMPIYQVQAKALENGASAYRREFARDRMLETILGTVGLALGSLAFALVLGIALAWASSRLPPRLQALRLLPILPMVLPAVASVLGWTFLLSPGPGFLNVLLRELPWWQELTEGPLDVYTLPWIIIVTALTLTAFVYVFLSAGFQNINSELIESAHVSGSGGAGVFFRVTLPLLRPQILYGGAVALMLGLGQFTAPLLLGRQSDVRVLTTEAYYALTGRLPSDPAAAAAIASPLLLFGLLVIFGQRFLLGNSARFVTHGGKSFRPVQRRSRAAVAIIAVYALLAIVLPLAALIVVSISPFWTSNINPQFFSFDNFVELFDTPALTEAIGNSVSISLAAVAISIPIGYLAASVLLQGHGMPWLRSILDVLVALPLGVPAVVLGVGFVLTYSVEPFDIYGTNWVMLVVYVTIMLPFTTRMHMAGMTSLGVGYVEASRVSGAGIVATNLRIVLPLLRSSVAGAAALMFVLLSHEFTASLLVRSTQTQVMGTILYDSYQNGSYPLVAAIAIVMTVVTFVGAGIALLVGGTGVFEDL